MRRYRGYTGGFRLNRGSTRCKKCGKEIRFIRTTSGKYMPCDNDFVYYKEKPEGQPESSVDGSSPRQQSDLSFLVGKNALHLETGVYGGRRTAAGGKISVCHDQSVFVFHRSSCGNCGGTGGNSGTRRFLCLPETF